MATAGVAQASEVMENEGAVFEEIFFRPATPLTPWKTASR